jgi:hypothetical protein
MRACMKFACYIWQGYTTAQGPEFRHTMRHGSKPAGSEATRCKFHGQHGSRAYSLCDRMAGADAAPVSEWAPRMRSASGCVCTILTSNIMGAHSWGAAAVEIARNWAVAHGYRYVRFSETSHYNTSARVPRFVQLAAENNKAVQFWFKPQAMLSLLERGEEACPW